MIIDGRDILTTTGAEIGRAATGSVTLTNGATWELNNSLIQIGLEGGTGILNVHNGSKITGIAGLRVGEFYETGEGLLSIDGAISSVATNHIIVGDQNHGKLLITTIKS